MKLLINCRDDYEANVIEGLLKVANIPVHKRYRGAGEAMKFYGGVGQNIDIYVPADRLEEARLLLESSQELDE